MAKVVGIVFLMVAVLVSYQNCSMYQSEDIKDFERLLNGRLSNGCMPHLDINVAADVYGVSPEALVLAASVNASGNFTCTISNIDLAGDLSGTTLCTVGEEEFEAASYSTAFDDLYMNNSYCGQTPNQFNNCEHIPFGIDSPRGQLVSSLGYQLDTGNLFLAYFKTPTTPANEGDPISGYGFAAYEDNNNVAVTVKRKDSQKGVSCTLKFEGAASDLLNNSQRAGDWNTIKATNPNYIGKLQLLTQRILESTR